MIDLQRFRAGDSEYFAELISAFGPLVITVTRAHTKNPEDAEDLFQETWIRAYEKRHTFLGTGAFEAWIRRVANNVCNEDHRARRKRKLAMKALLDLDHHEGPRIRTSTPLEELERKERQLRIQEALSLVTERQREAMELRFFEGLRGKEIATIMGVEEATVRSLIRNGLHRLRTIAERLAS